MEAIRQIMSLSNRASSDAVVEALGLAGGTEAIRQIMSLSNRASSNAVVKALGLAGSNTRS